MINEKQGNLSNLVFELGAGGGGGGRMVLKVCEIVHQFGVK